MKNQGSNAPDTDLDRLKAEYLRRDQSMANRDRYSIFNPANLFIQQSRQRATLACLRQLGYRSLVDTRVLDVGCGIGSVLLEFLGYGVKPNNLHGIDLLPHRLSVAHSQLPQIPVSCADGQHLPYPNESFDLVLQYTVFSSILDESVRNQLAQELLRVVRKPNGVILWYDFWINPKNHQTRGIRPNEILGLFPNCKIKFKRITLAPPILRRAISISWIGCLLLEKLYFINSHYLAVIIPPSSLQ